MKLVGKSRKICIIINENEILFINSSLMNIDNVTTSINFINPVNTFVTGEVIVERNEHKSSRLFLCLIFQGNSFEI
jgi:hypothetical protein